MYDNLNDLLDIVPMDHCDRPCDTRWANLPIGQHDFASVDPSGREHCGHCETDTARPLLCTYQ